MNKSIGWTLFFKGDDNNNKDIDYDLKRKDH